MFKGNDTLLLAVKKGYKVTEAGQLVNRKGESLVGGLSKGYQTLCVKLKNSQKCGHVLTHRIQAYQKFGDRIFAPGIQVRHLDGNPLNNAHNNIEIGTQSDNRMDVPEEIRQRSSKIAASYTRKLSEEEVSNLRLDRSQGATYEELIEKYNISKSTISYVVNRKTYKHV